MIFIILQIFSTGKNTNQLDDYFWEAAKQFNNEFKFHHCVVHFDVRSLTLSINTKWFWAFMWSNFIFYITYIFPSNFRASFPQNCYETSCKSLVIANMCLFMTYQSTKRFPGMMKGKKFLFLCKIKVNILVKFGYF